MKPIHQLTDDELHALAEQASTLADAPSAWTERAMALARKAQTMPSLLEHATRVLVAALRFDSWAAPSFAHGMRALPAETRHLLFSTKGRDIDLRITPDDTRFLLVGQVLGPDETGRVELIGNGNDKLETAIDDLGEFRLPGVVGGTYWVTLRMGQDEITLPPIEVGGRYV